MSSSGKQGNSTRTQRIRVALLNEPRPYFGAEVLELTSSKLGKRSAPGAILRNCFVVRTSDALTNEHPKIIIVAQDDLVRDFVENACKLQTANADRPNIPILFLRKESFTAFYLNDAGIVTNRVKFRWQNVQVFARR